ncbi:hypothetical protein ALC62_10033, partial [Cyphomyrmex costatus]
NVHLRCGTCGGLLWSGVGPGPEGGGGNGGIGGVDRPVAGGTVVAGSRMLQRTRWPGPAAAETPAATPDQSNTRHVFLRSYILVRELVRKKLGFAKRIVDDDNANDYNYNGDSADNNDDYRNGDDDNDYQNCIVIIIVITTTTIKTMMTIMTRQ